MLHPGEHPGRGEQPHAYRSVFPINSPPLG